MWGNLWPHFRLFRIIAASSIPFPILDVLLTSFDRQVICIYLYDYSGWPSLRLKVRLLKAEVVETLLYGCMTWSPKKPDYDRLRQVHHSTLLRCLGWRKRKRDDPTLLYADALSKTAFESIEAIVRKQRILFAGFVARMGEERLPQRVMFGELVGGKGYSGGQEKDWMAHLKEDIYVGFWNEIRRMAKGCSEGWQMVSKSRGGSRVVHAELA